MLWAKNTVFPGHFKLRYEATVIFSYSVSATGRFVSTSALESF